MSVGLTSLYDRSGRMLTRGVGRELAVQHKLDKLMSGQGLKRKHVKIKSGLQLCNMNY